MNLLFPASLFLPGFTLSLYLFGTLFCASDAFVVPSHQLHHALLRTIPSTAPFSSSSLALYLFGRFRKKQKLQIPSVISVGSLLPDVDVEMLIIVKDDDDEGDTAASNKKTVKTSTIPISIKEVLGTGKSILVGMPGAFTPVCTSEHLPGFIAASSKLGSLGIDTIAIVTTNDRFVNEEWSRQMGLVKEHGNGVGGQSGGKITILSDGDAELVKALGLAEDMGFGIGIRSKRFALICEDGVVTTLLTDTDDMDRCDMTSAANLVRLLTPPDEEGNQGEAFGLDTNVLLGSGLAVAMAVVLATMFQGQDQQIGSPPAPITPSAASITLPKVTPKRGASTGKFSVLNQYVR